MNRPKDGADRAFEVLGLALVGAVLGLVLSRAVGLEPKLTWTATWEFWTVLTAVGTLGATLIALWLASRSIRQERDRVSRVVSVWVTDEYLERSDANRYRRRVTLHIANESDEPVFNARVNVTVGEPAIRLGPLSAPPTISVIPPRRELEFDISIALRAHEDTWSPRADLYFTDPFGRRWLRDASGSLINLRVEQGSWSDGTVNERQLGDQGSVENPMMVALALLAGIQDEKVPLDDLPVTLALEADWAATDWPAVRAELASFQPTSMVDYPAPSIARVKLVGDPSLQGKTVIGEGMSLGGIPFKTLTLTRSASRGWRVYSIGSTARPDDIVLPDDAFG